MLKLVSFHIQAHLSAFLQILEYFSQICLGPIARESPCINDAVEKETVVFKGVIKCHFTNIKTLKTKRRLLYLKTQSVPRSKHLSSPL